MGRVRPCGRTVPRPLLVYQLPDGWEAQQRYIDRAEEDLLCAVGLCRRGTFGYIPLVNVCYLLHQAIEKWLKMLIAVQGVAVPRLHELHLLLDAVAAREPQVMRIRDMIVEVDEVLLSQKFPSNLRYEETPPEVERYIDVLMRAAFMLRKIAKRWLRREGPDGSQV